MTSSKPHGDGPRLPRTLSALARVIDGRRGFISVMLAVTAAKLALAAVVGSTADVGQTLAGARAFVAGRDVLDPGSTGGNPLYFLMGHSYIAAACLLVAQTLGLSFAFVIKTPAILADLLIVGLLATVSGGGAGAALLYLLNPVTILLSVYHGQVHTVAVAGAVLALWLAERGRSMASAFVLALAATVRQHFAVLIVPLWMGSGARRALTFLGFAFTLLLLNVPLFASAHPGRVLMPMSNTGLWGYAMIVRHGPRVLALAGLSGVEATLAPLDRGLETYGPALYWIWTIVFVVWVWWRRVEDLWRAALVYLLGFYAIGPGFGVQWLIWAVPFWLVVERRQAVLYCVLAGSYLMGSYWQWGLNAKYGVWSVTANLHVLSRGDLLGLILVGALGFFTWAFCARAAWRLAWR